MKKAIYKLIKKLSKKLDKGDPNPVQTIRLIDELLEPEVRAMMFANKKSFEQYGHIFNYEEFLTPYPKEELK